MRSRKLCFLFCTVVCGIVPLAASAAEPPWIEASDRNSAIVIEISEWVKTTVLPRTRKEHTLGPRFEQRRFHDLVIAQGLLPPKLLERTVMQEIERMR